MRHLIIQNFGPVKSANLELKSFNFLIGEQSIGKSTIAKLIAIFTDYANLSTIVAKGIRAWRLRLQMFDLNIYDNTDYRIQYEYKDNQLHFTISINKNRVITSLSENGERVLNKDLMGRRIASLRIIKHKEDFLKSILNEMQAKDNVDPRYMILSLQALIESSLYVPAERIAYSLHDNMKSALSLLGDSTTYTYRRFMINLEKARARLKKFESPLLKMTYLNEEEGQFFIDEQSKNKYHLYSASSGIQSSIPLLLVLEDIKNREYSSIVIEEPETNLFPNTQVEVLRLILEKARVDGRIVTITTHSPYLLSALNNSLYAGYIERVYGKGVLKSLDNILPKEYRLSSIDCSVYSIGASINGGEYCKSLINDEVGMIDSNSLDKVSFSLSDEFDALQDVVLESIE